MEALPELKQQLFPDQYDFSDIMALKSCMAITERAIPRYTPYRDVLSIFGPIR